MRLLLVWLAMAASSASAQSLTLVYQVDNRHTDERGEAVLHISNSAIANHYRLPDMQLSQITRQGEGQYVLIHSHKQILFRDFQPFYENASSQLKAMAERMGKSEQQLWKMMLDPSNDPSAATFSQINTQQYQGVRDEVVVYRVQTEQSRLSTSELEWLKNRLEQQMRIPQSGLGLMADNVDELLRLFTYDHDALPSRIEDLDSGYVLTLQKQKWGAVEPSAFSLPAGYLKKDITEQTLNLMEYLQNLNEQKSSN